MTDLDIATLGHIFSMMDNADDVAKCACVCTSWLTAVESSKVWEFRLRQDFGAEVSPCGASWPGPPPASRPHQFPKGAWVEWNEAFVGPEVGAVARRATVKRMLSVITRLKAGLLSQGLHGAIACVPPPAWALYSLLTPSFLRCLFFPTPYADPPPSREIPPSPLMRLCRGLAQLIQGWNRCFLDPRTGG
jgi:hypothetical protein